MKGNLNQGQYPEHINAGGDPSGTAHYSPMYHAHVSPDVEKKQGTPRIHGPSPQEYGYTGPVEGKPQYTGKGYDNTGPTSIY